MNDHNLLSRNFFKEKLDRIKRWVGDNIHYNSIYKGKIPFTNIEIYTDEIKYEPYKCFCYHFSGITLNIKKHFNDEEICGICLKKWDLRNNDVIKLSCNHYFHKECVLEWFSNDCSNSCPICRCPHDSCFTAERELALNTLNGEFYKDMAKSNQIISVNNNKDALLAVVTHILPFSVNSIKRINISSLFAKEFTITSVISEHLFNKLKTMYNVRSERDDPAFYLTSDNDVYMSDKYIKLPISFPFIYYKNSLTTNNCFIYKYGKTPKIIVKFKIINFIQEDLLLLSNYDLSKNCIYPVETHKGFQKDSSGNVMLDKPVPNYNVRKYSLMKVENYVKEEYLIPYAYIVNSEFDILLTGEKSSRHEHNLIYLNDENCIT